MPVASGPPARSAPPGVPPTAGAVVRACHARQSIALW
jgi:hypothetical protein